jgi:hypothetical protein
MLNNIPNGWRPATIKLGFITLIASCIFFAWPATAEVFKLDSQWTCGKTVELVKVLKSAGEDVFITGEIDGVVMLTVWVNPATRTFTAVGTLAADPDTSCIIIHGTKATVMPPKNMV